METPKEHPCVPHPPREGASNTGLSWKPDLVNAYKVLACNYIITDDTLGFLGRF